MHFYGGQAVQRLGNSLVGQLQGFLEGFALDHFGGHGAGGDGRAAAEGLELSMAQISCKQLQVMMKAAII